MTKLKIIFIGTGDFAAPIIKTLAENRQIKIGFVVTAPDKPSGRKKQIIFSPVKKIALKKKIPVLQPQKIIQAKDKIAEFNPDLIITADYGQIIPKAVLDLPKYGSVNIHPSLLPKYRGSSPIQYAILNNDKKTGISIILMDEKIDHGPIISQIKTTISPNDTSQNLEKKLSKLAASFLIKTLTKYIKGEIKPKAQKHNQATYTKRLIRQDGRINFKTQNAREIERKIRVFTPWPGTWTILDKKRIKIIKAQPTTKPVSSKNQLIVKTKKGNLELELIQPEGKKIMTGPEFARGLKAKP